MFEKGKMVKIDPILWRNLLLGDVGVPDPLGGYTDYTVDGDIYIEAVEIFRDEIERIRKSSIVDNTDTQNLLRQYAQTIVNKIHEITSSEGRARYLIGKIRPHAPQLPGEKMIPAEITVFCKSPKECRWEAVGLCLDDIVRIAPKGIDTKEEDWDEEAKKKLEEFIEKRRQKIKENWGQEIINGGG